MMKKITLFVILIFTLLFTVSLETNANGLPYGTYTYSSSQRSIVWTQDAYLPLSISYNLGGLTLSNPQDMTVDDNDNVYIADYGNGRVIKYSLKDDIVTSIGDGILNQPNGVHVGIDGNLYVADFGNKQGYQFIYDELTQTYSLGSEYTKPVNTPYFTVADA
ncbi:MAG TPA: hypothetical protein DDW82_07810, partial [Acholeplasmataceae bacterium]|nr:hypothetical protein [Acholeplasmataceae bacterium]